MTGFAEQEGDGFTWEIRAVNHRFLELAFRLPDGFRDLERNFRDRARSQVKRGKIDATLRLVKATTAPRLELNRRALLQLLAAMEQIRRDAPEIGHPDPIELLRWPGILADEPTPDDIERQHAAVTAGFDEALDRFNAHREREGDGTAAILTAKLDGVERLQHEVTVMTRDLMQTIRGRLERRVAELATQVDPERLAQEIALLAQRADVAEELDRLRIHVEECRKCLAGDGPHGRRLDFLMQELNREANTLASKSILPECSRHAVDLKVLIEQMREQVQNLE